MSQRKPKNNISQDIANEIKQRLSQQKGSDGTLPPSTIEQIRSRLTPKQLGVIDDPARLRAVLCSRRSGKSTMGISALVLMAISAPQTDPVNCLYLGLTRGSAKAVALPMLMELDRELNLRLDPNIAELTFGFPNGSQIIVSGCDVDYAQMQRLRGLAYALCIIDEAQNVRFDLEGLVWDVLKPASIDKHGSIILAGTPGYSTTHYFYKVSDDPEPKLKKQWSRHHWTTYDNPGLKDVFTKEIEDYINHDHAFLETPKFQREYMGKWVTDTTKLVYHYLEERNAIETLPPNDYRFIVACDLGYKDDTAFVVLAYADNDSNLYIIDAYKKDKLDFIDVGLKLKAYVEEFKPIKLIIDGANKQGVETMRRRMGLPLITADKRGKEDHIDLANTELVRGKVKLLAIRCEPLIKEMQELIWEVKKDGRRREHPSIPNHLCDSFLYGFVASANYIKDLKDQFNKHGSVNMDPYEQATMDRLQRKANQGPPLLGEWNNDNE